MDIDDLNDTHTVTLKNSQECKDFWYSIMSLTYENRICGIHHKKHQFIPSFAEGFFEYFTFNGLYISITDTCLKNDLILSGIRTEENLELSFLLEGEQIISLLDHSKDLVYESSECYLLYLSKTVGKIRFSKNQRFKEIKIKLRQNFIDSHQLNDLYDLRAKYSLDSQNFALARPICVRTQEILFEILLDKRQGVLKRLFLESKVLELLSLQLDTERHTKVNFLHENLKTAKKIYEIQKIVKSNLTTQFSVQQLSRKVGLNDFMVKKEFKRIFGKTVFEYALSQRMVTAKKLLSHSKKPIYEISELVGYKNATHFTAAFKKTTGTTPRKYRGTL